MVSTSTIHGRTLVLTMAVGVIHSLATSANR